ncbi:MAG: tetratricopeptide repeat protein, partial [Deltaproteobacteria bacterium]|nr:tetratricopeptide repeat protein [Deltaproteobacteria bacterium]
MDIDELDKYRQQATQKMATGDFEGALNLVHKIQSLGSHYIVSYAISGFLIDIGVAMGNEAITKEGVELLQKDIETIVHCERYAPTACYNLANGYSALFRFKKMSDPYVACFKKTELDQAKVYYRKALEYDLQDPMLASLILVNLGNCFDNLGRVIDALECYEEALKWKPDHGMALGNKGLALFNYARLTSEHQGTFLVEAHSLLSEALKFGVLPEAVSVFSQYLEVIRKRFPDKQILNTPPKYPGYTIKAKSKFERF